MHNYPVTRATWCIMTTSGDSTGKYKTVASSNEGVKQYNSRQTGFTLRVDSMLEFNHYANITSPV